MIVVVSGLPGSGKSYFAEALSRRLGAVYISSDHIRNSMRARGKYSFEDKLKVYHTMAEYTSANVSAGNHVVVDATFYRRTMVDVFTGLAAALSSKIHFIHVTADEELIKIRLNKPRKDSEADYDAYLKVKQQFEPLQVSCLTLRSENDNVDTMLEIALEYIREKNE